MSVYDVEKGRLGNAIFRYLASSVFAIVHDLERETEWKDIYNLETQLEYNYIVDDTTFVTWKNNILNGVNLRVNVTKRFVFDGYYQHDDIFKKYKTQLIDYIRKYPDHVLKSNGDPNLVLLVNNDSVIYKAIDILHAPSVKYDIVVHLRLEDFIYYDMVMNPKCIVPILNQYQDKQICMVVQEIKTDMEKKYIQFFKNKYNIIIESNDVITDYHIMQNAKVLICSCSTLSWCASLFSETLETVYFPNYTNSIHQTFKFPIKNTILYEYQSCSKELINVL